MIVLLIGTASLGACDQHVPGPATVRALVCDECVDGEYDSVVVRGDAALPALARAIAGPGSAHQARIRAAAKDDAVRVAAFDSSHVWPNAAARAELAVRRFRSSWQRRAIMLMRRIGTPAARHALRGAVTAIPINARFALDPGVRAFADSVLRTFP
jgi:hypothetical protein